MRASGALTEFPATHILSRFHPATCAARFASVQPFEVGQTHVTKFFGKVLGTLLTQRVHFGDRRSMSRANRFEHRRLDAAVYAPHDVEQSDILRSTSQRVTTARAGSTLQQAGIDKPTQDAIQKPGGEIGNLAKCGPP